MPIAQYGGHPADARHASVGRSGLIAAILVTTSSLVLGCTAFDPPFDASANDPNRARDSGRDSAAVETCTGPVVLNEIDGATTGSAFDREFIELVNTSAVAQNIGGLFVTRRRASGPDASKARVVPEGFVLRPGAFLYIVADVSGAEAGLQTDCIDGAPTPCLHVSWDLDATGDVGYLLDRSKATILCTLEYPGTVSPAAAWGRLTDGEPAVGLTQPTPGAANVALAQ